MALRILFSASHDVVECQRHAGRKLFENLDHDTVGGFDAPVQGLAAIGLVVGTVGPERPRGCAAGCPAHRTAARWCRWRPAPRPASSRDAARRPARTAAASIAIGLGAQLVADPLHALGRTQIDIDHDAGEIVRPALRESPRSRSVSTSLTDCRMLGQFAALIAPIRRQQQPAFGRSLIG